MVEALLVALFGLSAGVGGGAIVLLLTGRFPFPAALVRRRRRPQAVRCESRAALRLAMEGGSHGDH